MSPPSEFSQLPMSSTGRIYVLETRPIQFFRWAFAPSAEICHGPPKRRGVILRHSGWRAPRGTWCGELGQLYSTVGGPRRTPAYSQPFPPESSVSASTLVLPSPEESRSSEKRSGPGCSDLTTRIVHDWRVAGGHSGRRAWLIGSVDGLSGCLPSPIVSDLDHGSAM